mmetsp:Transcript_23752/g.66811  ORF Transcript_23752/g.66811 Transcript_23752/m.66811 type:complete len:242 (+) Transcript_23752:94-819(+)
MRGAHGAPLSLLLLGLRLGRGGGRGLRLRLRLGAALFLHQQLLHHLLCELLLSDLLLFLQLLLDLGALDLLLLLLLLIDGGVLRGLRIPRRVFDGLVTSLHIHLLLLLHLVPVHCLLEDHALPTRLDLLRLRHAVVDFLADSLLGVAEGTPVPLGHQLGLPQLPVAWLVLLHLVQLADDRDQPKHQRLLQGLPLFDRHLPGPRFLGLRGFVLVPVQALGGVLLLKALLQRVVRVYLLVGHL